MKIGWCMCFRVNGCPAVNTNDKTLHKVAIHAHCIMSRDRWQRALAGKRKCEKSQYGIVMGMSTIGLYGSPCHRY